MTQWEYTISNGPDFLSAGHLNSHGGDGWELVTIISRPGMAERAVFKRPLAAGPAVKVPAKKNGIPAKVAVR